jgi:hypothetical protein
MMVGTGTAGYVSCVVPLIYYVFVFLAGLGCGIGLAFRLGGKRALFNLSMREYADRLRRTGLD